MKPDPLDLARPLKRFGKRRQRNAIMTAQVAMIAQHLGGWTARRGDAWEAYRAVLGYSSQAEWSQAPILARLERHEAAMDRLFAAEGIDRHAAPPEALAGALKRLLAPTIRIGVPA